MIKTTKPALHLNMNSCNKQIIISETLIKCGSEVLKASVVHCNEHYLSFPFYTFDSISGKLCFVWRRKSTWVLSRYICWWRMFGWWSLFSFFQLSLYA